MFLDLRFRWCPIELARLLVDASHPLGTSPPRAKRSEFSREIRVGRSRRERQQLAFENRLITDRTRTGAVLTSPTVIVMVSTSINLPSDTITSSINVPGPCDSVGVQVNSPVSSSILAPAGTCATERKTYRVCGKIRVCHSRCERQLLTFINRLTTDRIEHRSCVDFADGDREVFHINQLPVRNDHVIA